MPTTTSKSAYREGVMAGLPFTMFAWPFAMLFGLVAAEAGLNVTETMAFSVIVIAGASQFTAIQLMTENAPVFVILIAALAVNLRMAMYSASLQPHLGGLPLGKRMIAAYCNLDQSFALGSVKYESEPDMPIGDKYLFFLGTVSIMIPFWIVGTYFGAVAGDAVPESLALDFAMPILFLALVGPMLRTFAHVAAAATSIIVSLLLAWMPSGIGLLFAGAIAMAVGAEIERRMGK